MCRESHKKQRGFTIIELLVATLVFSLLLIVMLAAFIRTGDMFYKGVSMSKTQEDARNIVQSIANDIQFTGASAPNVAANITSNPIGVFCVGQHRYAYQVGAYVGQAANYGLARDNVGAGVCPAVGTGAGQQILSSGTGEVKMLDADMQLNNLVITCAGGQIKHCTIQVRVVFYSTSGSGLQFLKSADQFFTGTGTHSSQAPDAQCTGTLNDSSLCAAVDYRSTVLGNT